MRSDIDPRQLTSFNNLVLEYICGHCDKPTAGFVVASHPETHAKWLICLNCKYGSIREVGIIYPSPLLGQSIIGLPDIIKSVYDEARKSFSSNSYTACELVCRKILMNVAVEKGAEEQKQFAYYIDHLVKSEYITPPMKEWVNIIRENGNESTHEIKTPVKERAENTLIFTAQLLKLVYETKYYADMYNNNNS